MSSISLLLSVLTGSPIYSAPAPMVARAEARVSVKIVRGARISWDMRERPESARLSKATFSEQGGQELPARFIEFE